MIRDESTNALVPARRGSAAKWMIFGALALAVAVPLFLEYLLACDREGKRTLYQLSAPIAAIVRVGDDLSRVARARPVALGVAVSLVLVLAALAIGRPRLPTKSRLLLAGLTLLALSLDLFLTGHPALACVSGAVGAVVLLRGGLLALPTARPASHFLPLFPVVLGAALRFFSLQQFPGGFSEHAVVHHLNSSIRYKETLLPLLSSWHFLRAAKFTGRILMGDHFGLMSILAAIGFEGLGVSFLSARLLTALAGTLTLAAAYFMGRVLEDERTGILFAFLLAISPWHLTVSRYSDLEHVLCPLQLVLALGLYGLAVRSGRLAYYALAGLALGFSWYVYAPNQVLPLVVALHLAATAIFCRGFLRKNALKIGVFALIFAAAAAAPIRAVVRGRVSPTTGYEAALPLRDLPRHGRMLAAAGHQLFSQVHDEWFFKPGGGLSLTESALLLPGLILCVAGLRRRTRFSTSGLLLLALPISLIPGILAPDESFRRFYPTATLALFLAAVVLSRSVDALRGAGIPSRVIAGAGVAFVVALTAVNTSVYFNKSQIHTEESSAFVTEIARQTAESYGKEFVYIYPTPGSGLGDYYGFVRFATYERQHEPSGRNVETEDRYRVLLPGELFWILPDPKSLGTKTRILAEVPSGGIHRNLDVCAAISRAYPEAEEEAYRDRRGNIVLRSWRIHAPGGP